MWTGFERISGSEINDSTEVMLYAKICTLDGLEAEEVGGTK